MGKIRTVIFIDGFNVYHALDKHRGYHKYKWLNFERLAGHYVEKHDEIIKIFYFTAYAYWYPDKVQRHKTLIKALKANNIVIVLGKFKEKDRYCPLCCRSYRTHEEKQTDPKLSDFHNKTSRTGVSPVLRGEMLGQPGRLSYRGLGILANKNRSVWVTLIS